MATSPSGRELPQMEAVWQEDRLCSKCCNVIQRSKILSEPPSWDKPSASQFEQFEHYAERRDVEASSKRGCHLCSLALGSEVTDTREIWDKINGQGPATRDHHPDEKATRSVIVEISAFNAAETQWRQELSHSLRFDFNGSLGERREDWVREGSTVLLAYARPPAECLAESSGGDSAGIDTMAALSKSTDSEATFQLAIWWLQKCFREHKSCAQVQKQSPENLPERLVQVGKTGESVQWPRLVLRSDIQKNPIAYFTLSHCWGGLHPLCLTSQNFQSMRKGIRPADLPKTFRDAMMVTSRLGFEYIWIDSLCIMQDSEDDWRAQSSIMGNIYRNCVCTIAALSARNGHQGCFVERNPLKYRVCFITIGSNNTRYGIRGASVDNRNEYIRIGSQVGPLHKGAWVFQERLLSPRTLAYGSSSLYWDCLEGGPTSEWWPEGGGPDSSSNHLKSWMGRLLEPPKSIAQRDRFRRAWEDFVVTYSGCDLTLPKDKLVAIAGVVNQISTNSGLTFVGGVWEEFLQECLLWKVRPFNGMRLLTGVPSWSWASIDGAVTFDIIGSYTPQWKAEVLHVPTLDPLTGLPSTNDYSTNHLVLRAPLKQVEWSKSGLFYDIHRTDERYGPGEWWPDTENSPGTKIWCLHVILYKSTHPADKPEAAGLVIVPRNTPQSWWSRAGWFKQELKADEEYPMFYEADSQIVHLF